MSTLPDGSGGFVAFYRRYTKTWIHALAAAALTAFGTLATIHRWFVVLAVGAYVIPPIVLYLRRSTATDNADVIPDPSTRSAEPVRSDDGDGDGDSDDGDSDSDSDGDSDSDSDGDSDSDSDNDDGDSDDEPRAEWQRVDSPTERSLRDVCVTDSAAFAVGADGVVLLDDGTGWRTLLADGPGAASKTLRGVEATADGGAVWVAGDGGAVARLHADTGRHVDLSAPNDRTDTWTDVAVGGSTDDERVLLANGSGEVVRGRYRDGDLSWDEPTKPGGGSSLSGITLVNDSVGYACDTNDGVFETTDGGETFRRIGIDGPEGTLTDVAATGRGDCRVTADDGVLHRRDGDAWTPLRLGDEPLAAIAFHGDHGVVCGGTAVYERAAGGIEWDRSVTVDAGSVVGVSVGADRAVAVGSNGTILARSRITDD